MYYLDWGWRVGEDGCGGWREDEYSLWHLALGHLAQVPSQATTQHDEGNISQWSIPSGWHWGGEAGDTDVLLTGVTAPNGTEWSFPHVAAIDGTGKFIGIPHMTKVQGGGIACASTAPRAATPRAALPPDATTCSRTESPVGCVCPSTVLHSATQCNLPYPISQFTDISAVDTAANAVAQAALDAYFARGSVVTRACDEAVHEFMCRFYLPVCTGPLEYTLPLDPALDEVCGDEFTAIVAPVAGAIQAYRMLQGLRPVPFPTDPDYPDNSRNDAVSLGAVLVYIALVSMSLLLVGALVWLARVHGVPRWRRGRRHPHQHQSWRQADDEVPFI